MCALSYGSTKSTNALNDTSFEADREPRLAHSLPDRHSQALLDSYQHKRRMSYSGYNQFSPYYQPPQQSSQQTNSGSNSGGAYSSNSSYQPLSAYQSEQQRQQQQQHQSHNQSSHQSNSNYNSQGYGNSSVTSSAQAALSYGNQSYGGVGSSSGRNNDPSNTYASSRPDTTALGNLAYASSLGPDQQQQQSSLSLSQLIDYNRSRSGYGTSGGYGGTSDTSHSYQRADGQSSNQQSTTGLPYTTTYQTSNTLPAYSSQSYGLNNTGRSSPAQHQYSNSSHQAQVNQAAPRQNNHTPQPARPASGQAMPRPKSQTGARSNHSPQVSTARVTQPSSSRTGGSHHHASSASTAGGQQARNNASPAQPRPAHAPPASSHPQSRSSATQVTQSNQSRKLSNTQAQTAKQQDARAKASEPAAGNSGWSAPPVTVNPNQIFNHSEWERRQEEEKAERLARAASAATKTPGDDVTQAAKALVGQSASANSESTTKEQIELEMKQMIEKMRDYKAKDPSLFSQVWEEVKKGDAAQRTPQPATNNAKAPAANGLPTPTTELPAESDLTATPPASDFDRGRYPMQRRKRGGSTYTPDRPHKSDKKKVQAEPPAGYERETLKDTTKSAPSAPPSAPPAQKQASTKTKETPKPSGQKAPTTVAGAKLPPPGTTYWPESKKHGLAIAARNALMYPAINHGKNIAADEIHALLDRNPSYAQMCEYLEAKGFVIERGPFARTLLAAVPEMGAQKNASTLAQSSPTPAPPASGIAPPPQPPAAQSHPPPYFAPPFNPALQFSSFQASSGQPQNGSPASYAGFQPNDVKPEDGPAQPPKPLSKEEKAKKRTFADIVDLSQLSDEDDFVRHRPKPRTEKPPSAMPNGRPNVTGTTNDALNARWRPPGAPMTQLQSPPSVPPPAPSKPMPRQIPRHMPHLNSREHLLYDLVVEPMNKRRDALRRSSYDPKTIARDILLASGKHPSMPPLNEHLEALRDKFMSVDSNSDLSTFRWDLVDPGGDPAPKASARPVENNEPSLFLSDHEPTSPSSPALEAKSRSAVVAVSVEGRSDSPAQPTSQGSLKGKYGRRGRPPKKRFNVSGLGIGEAHPSAAVGVSPATPGGDQTTKGPPKEGSLPYTSPYPESTTDANTSFEPAVTLSSPRPVASPEVSGMTPSTSLPKRKGRPPGAKNRAPRSDKGIPKKVSQEFIPTSPRNITPSQIRPESSKPLRPSALRNTLTPSKSGIAVVIPSPTRSLESTSPALRPQTLGKDDSFTGADPSFSVYKCNWDNCPAELHNMKILRKHVRKQHRDRVSQVGPWQCKWGGCKSPFERYTDPEKWERHMEQRHLRPYEQDLWGRGGKERSGESIFTSCALYKVKGH